MRHTNPSACLSVALLRHVRDARPTVADFIAWLGPNDAGKYHVLRKAGLLMEDGGRVILAPGHCTADARGFRFKAQLFLLDEDLVMIFRGDPVE